MGNLFESCYKRKIKATAALSVEEEYESLSNGDEELNYLTIIFYKWYGEDKHIKWKNISRNDIRETYSKEEYDRRNYVPFT